MDDHQDLEAVNVPESSEIERCEDHEGEQVASQLKKFISLYQAAKCVLQNITNRKFFSWSVQAAHDSEALPVTSASCERSFLSIRMIKIQLQNCLKDTYLDALILMAIEGLPNLADLADILQD